MTFTLTEYLLRLARDQKEAEKFRGASESDKKKMMEAVGLSTGQQAAVLSGDRQRISQAIADEFEGCGAPGTAAVMGMHAVNWQ